MRRIAVLRALCLLLLTCVWAERCSAAALPLTFCFEDVAQAPWTMPDGTGLNITLLRRVEKRLGEHFVLVAKPWKRCQEEVRAGVLDGYFGAANSADRRTYAVVPSKADGSDDPSRAMYEDSFNVYLRIGGAARWDGKRLRSPGSPVLSQDGYVVTSHLRERGYAVNDSIKSAEDGLRLLAHGDADVAVLQGLEAMRRVASDARFRDRIVLQAPPYEILPLYLMIGRKAYAAERARIEAIWDAIRKERASPDYRRMESAAE